MDRLVVWPVKLLMALFQALPERRAMALGRRAGRLVGRIFAGRRAIVLDNLRRAYRGELSEARLRELVRLNFEHYGQCAIEFLRIPLLTAENLDRHATFHREDLLRAAVARGPGAIVLCGHYGNWDIMAVAQALRGLGAHIITKEARHRGLNDFWMDLRRAKGVQFLAAANSAGALLRVLKRGGIVAVILDQHRPRASGVEASFFGRPASTMRVAAALALRTGCPVVPVDYWRDERGHHQIEFHPALPVRRGESEAESILLTTQLYNDVIERFVRRHPEQWIWIHRRWKRHRRAAAGRVAGPPAPEAEPVGAAPPADGATRRHPVA
jgi:KDO2-lipid IV(A) lauroyltransferase